MLGRATPSPVVKVPAIHSMAGASSPVLQQWDDEQGKKSMGRKGFPWDSIAAEDGVVP